jgi:hypothetical protein
MGRSGYRHTDCNRRCRRRAHLRNATPSGATKPSGVGIVSQPKRRKRRVAPNPKSESAKPRTQKPDTSSDPQRALGSNQSASRRSPPVSERRDSGGPAFVESSEVTLFLTLVGLAISVVALAGSTRWWVLVPATIGLTMVLVVAVRWLAPHIHRFMLRLSSPREAAPRRHRQRNVLTALGTLFALVLGIAAWRGHSAPETERSAAELFRAARGSAGRPTFNCGTLTNLCQGPGHVQFNSFTNLPRYGDERQFVKIGPIGSAVDNQVHLTAGSHYRVQIYVDNNADSNFTRGPQDWNARDTTVTAIIPSAVVQGVAYIYGFVSASNARPRTIEDSVKLVSADPVRVVYEKGSGAWTNQIMKQVPLGDVTRGARVGYRRLDGVIPGEFDAAGYASFVVHVLAAG